MKKVAVLLLMISGTMLFFNSCRKDKGESDVDKLLFKEINQSGYTYYQNGNILPGASASPHGSFKLRFNATADSALDASGELPAGSTFPTGSVIVKEVISAGSISVYAVMKKDPNNLYEGSNWVWAEFQPNGNAIYSSAKSGSDCIGCHSEAPNRDLVRSFDFH